MFSLKFIAQIYLRLRFGIIFSGTKLSWKVKEICIADFLVQLKIHAYTLYVFK